MVTASVTATSAMQLQDGTTIAPGETIDIEAQSRHAESMQIIKGRDTRPGPAPRPAPAVSQEPQYAEFRLPGQLPTSLDGRIIERQKNKQDGRPIDDELLNAMHEALDKGRDAAQKALGACGAILQNAMLTPHARHVQMKDVAFKVTRPAFQHFDTVQKTISQRIALLEAETLPQPKTDAASAIRYGNIQRTLVTGGDKRRRPAILNAIKAGHDVVLEAISIEPGFMSGLEDAERDDLVRQWRYARHGDKLERIEHLKKQFAHIDTGVNLLRGFMLKLFSENIASKAERLNATAAAAIKGL